MPKNHTNQEAINHYATKGTSWGTAVARAKRDGVDLNAAVANRGGKVVVHTPNAQPPARASAPASAPAPAPAPPWNPQGQTNQAAINHYCAATGSWSDAVDLAKKDGIDLYAAVRDRSGPVSVAGEGSGLLADPFGLTKPKGGIERHVREALGEPFTQVTGEKPIAEQGPLERIQTAGALDHVLSMDDLFKALKSEHERLGDAPDKLDLNETVLNTIKAMETKADHAGPRTLTEAMFRKIVPELSAARARELLPHLNQAMVDAKILTPRQQAAFIAQCAHETGGFRTLKEYGGPKYFAKYNGRLDLGNTQPGDGPRFPGRGAIQITGRANYTSASKDLFGDRRLVDHPELAEKPDIAFKVASWFWNEKKLNGPSEAGDLKKVTRRINGGMNGWNDRLTRYTRALDELTK